VSYNTELTSGNKADNDVNRNFDTAWGSQFALAALSNSSLLGNRSKMTKHNEIYITNLLRKCNNKCNYLIIVPCFSSF